MAKRKVVRKPPNGVVRRLSVKAFFLEAVIQRCSVKRCSQKFRKIQRKTTVPECLFFNKVAGLRLATILKKRLLHKCLPVNFAKFLRTLFMTEHLWWLLLPFFNNLIPFETRNIAEVLILGLNVINANDYSLHQFRKYF